MDGTRPVLDIQSEGQTSKDLENICCMVADKARKTQPQSFRYNIGPTPEPNRFTNRSGFDPLNRANSLAGLVTTDPRFWANSQPNRNRSNTGQPSLPPTAFCQHQARQKGNNTRKHPCTLSLTELRLVLTKIRVKPCSTSHPWTR